jgi:hypothetical protein
MLAIVALTPLACFKAFKRHHAPKPVVVEEDDGDLDPTRPVHICILAKEVDCLERRVECFGSITLKRADVWGQARLMRHRHEFEREMQKDLDQFKETLSGWVSRRDQAFLADAFTLQAAFGGGSLTQAGTTQQANQTMITTTNDPIQRNQTQSGAVKPGYATSGVGGSQSTLSISLEPTLHLTQKARYLNHLNELRRINEGDDNADSPGYALNLVRVPVSILTGSHTQEGYGAEVALTVSPHLSDDLLPTTFRNLVVQDLVDLATVPVAHAIGSFKPDGIDHLTELLVKLDGLAADYLKLERAQNPDFTIGDLRARIAHNARAVAPTPTANTVKTAIPEPDKTKVEKVIIEQQKLRLRQSPIAEPLRKPNVVKPMSYDADVAINANDPRFKGEVELTIAYMKVLNEIAGELGPEAVNVPTRQRVSPLPIPPSQLVDVFGPVAAARVVATVYRAVRNHLAADSPYHLDVQATLSDELQSAYQFLMTAQHRPLWDRFCTPELARAIRAHDHDPLDRMYAEFLTQVSLSYPQDRVNFDGYYAGDAVAQKPVTVFAWAILVETALLEDRLTEDMKSVQMSKGGPSVPEGTHFHGPDPCPEARQIFNDYVRARWPIYVFAIDPVTEDQNIADDYSMRREMQLAIALSFATGQLSASNMTKYTRRIEEDMNTIALNRTVIGFSHGDNNFGWRFYPRVQSPPIRGTLSTVKELVAPSNDINRDLRHRRLENGQRECTALMIMPSFVPNVCLEATTHWFRLDNPKVREGTMTDSLKLGKRVAMLQALAPKCPDRSHYRPEDVAMIHTKLDQLAARLPLQQQLINVPYENTAGGFRLFANGVTDLGPQLTGWYGAPGLKKDGETTIFLVGDNFSVHDTKVIIGGTQIDDTKTTVLKVSGTKDGVVTGDLVTVAPRVDLLSRQIMRVIVPANAISYKAPASQKCMADIHIATPYGVSRHIAIPVVDSCGPPAMPEPAPPPSAPSTPSAPPAQQATPEKVKVCSDLTPPTPDAPKPDAPAAIITAPRTATQPEPDQDLPLIPPHEPAPSRPAPTPDEPWVPARPIQPPRRVPGPS